MLSRLGDYIRNLFFPEKNDRIKMLQEYSYNNRSSKYIPAEYASTVPLTPNSNINTSVNYNQRGSVSSSSSGSSRNIKAVKEKLTLDKVFNDKKPMKNERDTAYKLKRITRIYAVLSQERRNDVLKLINASSSQFVINRINT